MLQYRLPDALRNESISLLNLPDDVEEILVASDIMTIGHLDSRLNDGSITTIAGIKNGRANRLQRHLALYCIQSTSSFWRFILRAPQLVYYAVSFGLTAFLLWLTTDKKFDGDEYAVLFAIGIAIIAFDTGRWVSRPRSTPLPHAESHVRALLVYIVAVLVLVLETAGEWGWQERLRIILIGGVFAVCEAAYIVIEGSIVPRRIATTPPSPNESLLDSWARRFRALEIEIQAAIVLGVLTVMATILAWLGDIAHTLLKVIIGSN